MKTLFFVIAIFVTGYGLVFATPPTLPAYDYNWFSFEKSFITTGLPEGVSLFETKETNPRWLIKNEGPTELLIVNSNFPSPNPDSASSSLLGIEYRLVNGEVYRIEERSEGGYRDKDGNYVVIPRKLVSRKMTEGDTGYVAPASLDIGSGFVFQLVMGIYPTKTIQDIHRPSTPEIPQPENFTIAAYYGNKPIQIHGVFRYSLNSNFGAFRGSEEEHRKYLANKKAEEDFRRRELIKIAGVYGGITVISLLLVRILWSFIKRASKERV